MRPFSTRCGGFTLLEAVASVAILAVALGALVVGHRNVVRLSASAANRARAARAASAWLTERALEEDWERVPREGLIDEDLAYTLADEPYMESLAPSLVKLTLKVTFFDPMAPEGEPGIVKLDEIVATAQESEDETDEGETE